MNFLFPSIYVDDFFLIFIITALEKNTKDFCKKEHSNISFNMPQAVEAWYNDFAIIIYSIILVIVAIVGAIGKYNNLKKI